MTTRKITRTRSVLKRFFISEQENELLKKNMETAAISNFGFYARKMCLNGHIFKVESADYREQMATLARTNFELNQIGKNINQLAKKLNIGKIDGIEETLLLKQEFQEQILKLKNEIDESFQKLMEG